MRLDSKVAIVTGAASGFGAEIARVFAREGAKVAVLDINGEGAAAVARGIGPAAIAIPTDVTKRADLDAAVAKTIDTFGKLDIVVNNAGWSHKNRPMLEVSEEEFDRVYAINVKSIYHMAFAAVPVLCQGRRRYHQHRLDGRHQAKARPHLVQWLEGCGEPPVALDGGRACAAENPRELRGASDGRDRPIGAVHGAAGHAGEPRPVHRDRAAGTALRAPGHCQRLPFPRLGRSGIRDRRGAGGGRRPHDLGPAPAPFIRARF